MIVAKLPCAFCGEDILEDTESDLDSIRLSRYKGAYYHEECLANFRKAEDLKDKIAEYVREEFPGIGEHTLHALTKDLDDITKINGALEEFAGSTYCMLTEQGYLLFADEPDTLADELLSAGISDSSEDSDKVKEIHVDQTLYKGEYYMRHTVVLYDDGGS